jgi:hypothetical protein
MVGSVGEMNSTEKHRVAISIVKRCYPTFAEDGEEANYYDLHGIDGHDNRGSIQVKWDGDEPTTGNICHEIYEKTDGKPEQKWRKSPGQADYYCFVALNDVEYTCIRIPIYVLAGLEQNTRLIKINPTSLSFLVPIDKVLAYDSVEIKYVPNGHPVQ